MAITNVSSNKVQDTSAPGASYRAALAVITTLFFMWGSLTSLNDVLIPYVQHAFKVKLAASMLVQAAFFSAYFFFSIPASKIIDWIGYKKAIIVGLLTMVVSCLTFYPAATIPSFPVLLTALIILAAGITILQVAANPYVAVLGPPRTASSRLNLTQAFNSLGTAVFPWVGANLILRTTTEALAQNTSQEADAIIKLYVYFFAAALLLLALGIGLFKLPKIESAEHQKGEKVEDSVWKHPNLIYGAIGIFTYVGAEVAIGSALANYLSLDNIGNFISPDKIADPALRYHTAISVAAKYISVYWLGAMFGRFLGSALLKGVKTLYLGVVFVSAAILVLTSYSTPGEAASWWATVIALLASIRLLLILCGVISFLAAAVSLFRQGSITVKTAHLLAIAALLAALLVTISVFTNGHVAMWSVLSIGFFNSIMFPCIFTMGIEELGPLTGNGSGILNMAIVGGAVIPYLVGKLGDWINRTYYPAMTQGEVSWGQGIHYALLVAALCYLYIWFFAVSGSKPNSERYAKAS